MTTTYEQTILAKINAGQALETFKDLKTGAKVLTDQLVPLNKGTDEYNQILQKLGPILSKITQIKNDSAEATRRATEAQEQANERFSEATDGTNTYSYSLDKLDEATKDYTGTVTLSTEQVGFSTDATRELSDASKDLTDNVEVAQKTIKDLRTEVREYKDQLVTLDRGSQEYRDTLEKLNVVQSQLTRINQDVSIATMNVCSRSKTLPGRHRVSLPDSGPSIL